MRLVIQRVNHASVKVDNEIIGEINKGFLVLIGISNADTQAVADKMIKKLIGLRIFEDENGKTNLDLKSVDGSLLLVSQFTLCADCKKGTRPSFDNAMEPVRANEFYEKFVSILKKSGLNVQTGKFGADMKVALVNNGPVTIVL